MGERRERTDEYKLNRSDFGLKPAERSIELLCTRQFPKHPQYVCHRILESGRRARILRQEPFF